MLITGKNYIGFELSGEGDILINSYNPLKHQDNPWTSIEATSVEINRATELAHSAFKIFRKTSDKDRAEFLEEIASQIELLGEDLIQVYVMETGLPEGRARGERTRTINQLRAFSYMLHQGQEWKSVVVDKSDPNREPLPKPDVRKTSIPIGPVAIFGASNYPLAFSSAGGDTASALASGCPVVLKSHPLHSGLNELVSQAIIKAAKKCNMPNGVYSSLNGSGIKVGKQLVRDSKIKAVGFTGSFKGGRALFDLANLREEPIPVFAEMGSVNPVFMFENALKKNGVKWAESLANSISLGVGQFCTNPGLIVGVKGDLLESFCSEVVLRIEEASFGPMLSPAIRKNFAEAKSEIQSYSSIKSLTPYHRDEGESVNPVILKVTAEEFITNPNLHQEVFGPFSIVVECEDLRQMAQLVESLEGQLTGTVIAENEDLDNAEEIIDELMHKVGRLIYNGVPTGVEVCPAMNHGGPYPASTNSRYTSVGLDAVKRWIRPISFQDFPKTLLPEEVRDV